MSASDGGSTFDDPIRLDSSDEEDGPSEQWPSPTGQDRDAAAAAVPRGSPSPPPPRPVVTGGAAPADAKLQRQRERAAAKQQKELDKQLRRAEAAAKRSARPEHCQKALHALVDRRVLEVAGGGQLLAVLQESSEVTVHVTSAPLPGTVTWRREVTDWTERDGQIVTNIREEPQDQLVAVMDAPTLADLVQQQGTAPADDGGLVAAMWHLGNTSGMKVTVLCWGLDGLCKTKTLAGSYRQAAGGGGGGRGRGRGAARLDRLQLEAAVVDALLDTPHSLRLVNTAAEGGQFLAQLSKAIAEAPFKRQRGQQQFAWFADADSARPVKVDRQLRGLRRLWTEQLRQLAGSLEAAQAVSAAYPSPQALLQAYAACDSPGQCERLVADLAVRRSVGPLVSSRRVGNELSRKLYLTMSTLDGSAEL